jgi:hypothetical protein
MKFSLTAVTAHRFLAKALRRLNPRIERLKAIISGLHFEVPPAPILMVTLVDKPAGYCRIVQNKDKIFQARDGFDSSLSLRPRDADTEDQVLFANIADGIEKAIGLCPFSERDRKTIVDALHEWKQAATRV